MTDAERFDALLEKYHALAMRVAQAPPVMQPPTLTMGTNAVVADLEPDMPPGVVLAAMKRISPTSDKAYEANWRYWEQNKEKAAEHPDAFAEEILAGVNAS